MKNSPDNIHSEETVIEEHLRIQKLPIEFVGRMKGTTPSVKDVVKFMGVNTGAVTVTQFKNGQEGQTIKISGDGQMTITHGANIKTNTAANKLLAVNKVYTFTRIGNLWIEDE